jgi:hypothetical protein
VQAGAPDQDQRLAPDWTRLTHGERCQPLSSVFRLVAHRGLRAERLPTLGSGIDCRREQAGPAKEDSMSLGVRMSRRPRVGIARYYTHSRAEHGTIVKLLFLRLLIPDRTHGPSSGPSRLLG